MLAWPMAIRPIVVVEAALRLGYWHGSLHQDAISAPQNGSSTPTLAEINAFKTRPFIVLYKDWR